MITESEDNDTKRINLSVGLMAFFLALAYSTYTFFMAHNKEVVFNFLQIIIIIYFSTAALSLLIFLIIKGNQLIFTEQNWKVSIVDFKPSEGKARFFYNLGMKLALNSPGGAFLIVYFNFVPRGIMNLGLSENVSYLIAFFIFLGATILLISLCGRIKQIFKRRKE